MSDPTPVLPDGVAVVREESVEVGGPSGTRGIYSASVLYPVPGWSERFPWLVHGTTGARVPGEAEGADFGLFGEAPTGEIQHRWRGLREGLGMARAVLARQVHGATVLEHTNPDPARAPGLVVVDDADGHVTGVPGILLTVSLADCVPITLVDPDRRRVGLLHAGWRGTGAGILAVGLRALGAEPGVVHAHLGPAICGRCYEVGPEVFHALGFEVPESNRPVDLRAAQARRLVDAGVPAGQISVSEWCTRCGGPAGGDEAAGAGGDAMGPRGQAAFFSHRGGDAGRHVGVVGLG